ncbi:MAG: ATP-binding protein, partial [Desulfuromonas sp.]
KPAEFPDADTDEWLPEGGYGLALIQELSDQLEHVYRDGKNILTIWKNIPHP